MYQIIDFWCIGDANEWLKENPDIEIIDYKHYQRFEGNEEPFKISILYKPFQADKTNYSGAYEPK